MILWEQKGYVRFIDIQYLLVSTALRREGHTVHTEQFFDTIKVMCASGDRGRQDVLWRAEEKKINLRHYDDESVSFSQPMSLICYSPSSSWVCL